MPADAEPEEPSDPTQPLACTQPGCIDELGRYLYIAPKPANLGAHKRTKHGIAGKGKTRKDPAPAGVTINLGQPKSSSSSKDKELAQVEQRAIQLVTTFSALLLLAGQPDDAMSLQKGAGQFGVAARDLAQYEAWLRKLATGGEVAGRTTAWLNMALAVFAMILPVLIHHEALPEKIAKAAAIFVGMAEALEEQNVDAPATAAA